MRDGIPRALRHKQASHSEDASNNTLQKKRDAPGKIGFDERAEVICPL